MTTHRRKDDESGKEFSDLFYTDRYFHEERGWFYYARGITGSDTFILGPFRSKEDAIYDCGIRFNIPNLK